MSPGRVDGWCCPIRRWLVGKVWGVGILQGILGFAILVLEVTVCVSRGCLFGGVSRIEEVGLIYRQSHFGWCYRIEKRALHLPFDRTNEYQRRMSSASVKPLRGQCLVLVRMPRLSIASLASSGCQILDFRRAAHRRRGDYCCSLNILADDPKLWSIGIHPPALWLDCRSFLDGSAKSRSRSTQGWYR